jgi:hypothetical protein
MPKAGWFVAGVAVAILLIPTAVGAKTVLKYTGIEGTSGNQADVTSAGQLQTAAAGPAAAYNQFTLVASGTTPVIAVPPAGKALMISSIDVDAWALSTIDPYIEMFIDSSSACTPPGQITYVGEDDPSASGNTVYPFNPGLPVPSGYYLCAQDESMYSDVTVAGYTIPAGEVPATAVQHSVTTPLLKK